MSEISLLGVCKRFGVTDAVRDVTLTVRDGEFFSLLGPSGSGKSTVLRLIAGFIKPSAGDVLIGGAPMAGTPPERRNVGFVFQDYALFPHLSVFDNVAFGLRARKVPRPEIAAQVADVLEVVGLGTSPQRRVTEMSGGERQRVAIARAIVTRPKVLLLDEPLGALDRLLREEMQFQLKDLQSRLGITTIHVTHDQSEALTMSDRIGVMHHGALHEIGVPRELYHTPKTRFTSQFMGENNILRARVAEAGPDWTLLDLGHGTLRLAGRPLGTAGSNMHLAVRPEDLQIDRRTDAATARGLKGQIKKSAFRGPLMRYQVATEAAGELLVDVHGRSVPLTPGEWVNVYWTADQCVVLPDDATAPGVPSDENLPELGRKRPGADEASLSTFKGVGGI